MGAASKIAVLVLLCFAPCNAALRKRKQVREVFKSSVRGVSRLELNIEDAGDRKRFTLGYANNVHLETDYAEILRRGMGSSDESNQSMGGSMGMRSTSKGKAGGKDKDPPTTAPGRTQSPSSPIDRTQAPSEAPGCPNVPAGGCSICGTDTCISKPDKIFQFPGLPSATCAEWEELGFNGKIAVDACALLPNLLGDLCGCVNLSPPTEAPIASSFSPVSSTVSTVSSTLSPIAVPPTTAPTPGPTLPPTSQPITPQPVSPQPTLAPVVAPACPEVPSTGCSVCGDNMCVTNADAVFSFPSQPSVPCGVLQSVGYQGLIPLDQCPSLAALIDTLCGCEAQQAVRFSFAIPVPPSSPPRSIYTNYANPISSPPEPSMPPASTSRQGNVAKSKFFYPANGTSEPLTATVAPAEPTGAVAGHQTEGQFTSWHLP